MSANDLLARWTAPAKYRVMADSLALAVPLVVGLAAIGWRLSGIIAAVAAAMIAAAIALFAARYRARRYDQAWLVHALDRERPDMRTAPTCCSPTLLYLARLSGSSRRGCSAGSTATVPTACVPTGRAA